MIELASLIADRRFSNTAKCMILLDHLGGRATTSDIVELGLRHGARPIRGWKVPTLLRQAKGRVAETPEGWLLLPAGREFLRDQGYEQAGSLNVQKSQQSKFIFIGHGHSPLWRELKDFLRERLGLEVVEFNSQSTVGLSNKERLLQMLDQAGAALLVLTAEDEAADGMLSARLNVIHEVGLFQGRLGFEKANVMLEEGCAEFSNIHGIGQTRFPRGRISAAFEDVRAFLEREGLL